LRRANQACILVVLVLSLFALPICTVEGQTAHLTVNLTGQSLTAGFNNNMTISIQNNYYSAIYDVGVAVSVPAPLSLLGDNLWHYDRLVMGQGVNLNFQVYAPTSAIGSSYVGTLTITYKQLGDVSYTTESHDMGMSVKGWISLILYGLQMTPSVTVPGGNATVSGNILNNGNLAAYNANVTVQSDVQVPGTSASVYIGEVDPNIPRPFSVLVIFKAGIAPGNYSVVVAASAIDSGKASEPYTVHLATKIEIRRAVAQVTTRGQRPSGAMALIFEILSYLYGVFMGSSNVVSPTVFAYSYLQAATFFARGARNTAD
jgi:hypothetical protein